MRAAPPPRHRRREPILDRLGRVAGEINPFLIIVVIMLALLNISCYAAIEIGRLYPPRAEPSHPLRPRPARRSAAPRFRVCRRNSRCGAVRD